MPSNIAVTLAPKVDSLWRSCFELENEMIVTSNGRRIFPTLEYCISGLNPDKTYSLSLHIELFDNKKLRFMAGKWVSTLSTEKIEAPRKVSHHNGAQSGSYWMAGNISFDRIRITNRKSKEDVSLSNIHLHTSHRYIPILSVSDESGLVHTARLPHTQFLTVTAYHGVQLNKLKTDNNPYATGSRTDRIRVRESSDDSSAEYGPASPKRTKIVEETLASMLPAFQNFAMMQSMLFPQLFQLPPVETTIPSAETVKEEPLDADTSCISSSSTPPLAEVKSEVTETSESPATSSPISPLIYNMIPMMGMMPNFQMFQPFYPFGFPLNPFMSSFIPTTSSVFHSPSTTPPAKDYKTKDTSDKSEIEVVV